MKKIIIIALSIVIITGCSIKRYDDKKIDDVVKNILYQQSNLSNHHGVGYKYYLPKTVSLLEDNNYNQILISSSNLYYIYIDITGYSYKIKDDYTINNSAYYSKKLSYNNKNGYLEITKVDKKYFIELMFNYAKMEAYVSDFDLMKTLSNAFVILKSIKYNDLVIKNMKETSIFNNKEKPYNIYQPKEKNQTFLDYLKEYDKYYDKDNELPDDEKLKKKE